MQSADAVSGIPASEVERAPTPPDMEADLSKIRRLLLKLPEQELRAFMQAMASSGLSRAGIVDGLLACVGDGGMELDGVVRVLEAVADK